MRIRHRRWWVAAVATAAFAATAAPSLASNAASVGVLASLDGLASAGGSAGVSGLAPQIVRGALDTGPAAGTVRLVLGLPFQDAAGLRAHVAQIEAGTAAPLSEPAFASRFAPTAATVSAVTRWAAGAGLTVDSVAGNRLLVGVSGPANAVGAAFGTSLHRLLAPGGISYITPVTAATLPATLAGEVTSVLGLSDLGRVTSPLAKPAFGVGVGASPFGPQQVRSYYDAPANPTASGQTLAVLAEGDLAQVQKDLGQFDALYGLPAPAVTVKKTGAGPWTDTSGQDEFDLDTQYSTGMAPGASLLIYDGPSLNDPDIATEVNQFVTDDLAKQGSFSAGECELDAQMSGMMASVDQSLTEAVAQGQTLFVSSGDSGGFCPLAGIGVNGVPVGEPGAVYPASSPFGIAVGGTTIDDTSSAKAAGAELAWVAGGGGPSLLEQAPVWQQAAVPLGTLLGASGPRGVPDVSLNADPTFGPGYNVIVSGAPTDVGGTSAGAPAWAGIWAEVQTADGANLGFAGPKLYSVPSAFQDIILGVAVPYPATPGWDFATGLGTPDISAIISRALTLASIAVAMAGLSSPQRRRSKRASGRPPTPSPSMASSQPASSAGAPSSPRSAAMEVTKSVSRSGPPKVTSLGLAIGRSTIRSSPPGA